MHRTPRRLADTRATPDGAVRGGHFLRVPVPANVAEVASAVVVSVTSVGPCGPGYLTAYDCGRAMPGTSTLNSNRRAATANMAIVPLAADGSICVYTLATTDVVVDLLGHLADGGQGLRTFEPLRLLDTRPGMPDRLLVPNRAMAPRSEMTVRLGGVVGSDATAVALNLIAVGPAGDGYLTAYPGPCGARPATSNINYVAGETIAGATITALGPDRSVCIYNHAGSHVVVDLTGVVEPSGNRLRTADNVRLVDTRSGSGARRTELRVSTDVPAAPAGHVGAMVNTVALGSRPGFASVRPCGSSAAPTTSTLNHLDRPIANVALVGATGRAFCVYRHVRADLVVDAVAWLVP